MRRRSTFALVLLAAGAGALIVGCSDRWCQTWTSQLLCDDFDDGNAVAQQGAPTLSPVGKGGTFALSATAYTPPSAALATSNAFSGDGGGAGITLSGGLSSAPQATPTTLTCQLQIHPQQLSTTPGGSASLFTLSISDGSGVKRGVLGLLSDGSGNATFTETYPADGGHTVVSHPVGAVLGPGWSFVALTLSTSGGASSFSVSLDGTTISGPLQAPLPSTTSMNLSFGPVDLGAASTGWSFLYDDVVCR